LSLKTKVDGLSVVWPQNHWDGFFGLASKPVATVSWLSFKTKVVKGFRFGLQNRQLRFGDLGIKIITTVFWFVPQNQAGLGLSVAPQNRWEDTMVWDTRRDLAACFAWKQV
jgi:hypothetical protein